MDIGSILLILSLALVTFLIISRPLLDRQSETAPLVRRQAARKEEIHRSALLAERDRVLTALEELDSDMQLGKFTPEDYQNQRVELMSAGAGVLKKLDGITQTGRAPAVVNRGNENGDVVEKLISERKQSRTEKMGGFCPKCGKPAVQSDKFCSRCGALLQAVESRGRK